MSLGPDRKRLRQLTLPLRATNILPLGGAVVAPSTEGAPMRALTVEEVARVTADTLAPEVRRPRKVRVELSVLEKRNMCMAIDARAGNKARFKIVAETYKMAPQVVHRIYKEKAKWFELYAGGLGKFQQIHKPRQHSELYQKGKELLETIRESQSVVTKSLMMEYFREVSPKVNGMSNKGRDCFWKRFKLHARVSRLRVSGCTQLLPTDYEARCATFTERLKSMNHQRGGFQVVVVGDETPVIWEPVTSVTYDIRGSKRVKVKTAGKEKTMTTAWFAARAERDAGDTWDITGDEWVIKQTCELPPLT